MDLYLMRHGLAEDSSSSGRDRDRELTPEGVERTRKTAKALASLGVGFDLVYTSPYDRARETARIIAEILCPEQPIQFDPLSSGEPTGSLLGALEKTLPRNKSILLVGHEPDLGRLISVLISGSPDLRITMKKGSLCKLHLTSVAPAHATFEWLLAPKHFASMVS